MLPKPEKNKKSTNGAEQLDFVDSLSHEKKVENKRRFVSIFLILTVGLSIGFWVYHSFKSFTFENPISKISFNMPQLSLNNIQINQNDLDKNIQSIISKDKNSWSIYVSSINPDNKTFTYQKNITDFSSTTLINDLSRLTYATQSSLLQSLPQGTKIQEAINSTDGSYSQESLITIPHQQILFHFKISGPNIDSAKNLIPSIAEKIYWQIMNLNQ